MTAFSAKALSEQEPVIQGCLDRFVDKLGPLSETSGGKGLDVVHWLEMAAFDLLGEMAFGEGFGCVQKGMSPTPSQLCLLSFNNLFLRANNVRMISH